MSLEFEILIYVKCIGCIKKLWSTIKKKNNHKLISKIQLHNKQHIFFS